MHGTTHGSRNEKHHVDSTTDELLPRSSRICPLLCGPTSTIDSRTSSSLYQRCSTAARCSAISSKISSTGTCTVLVNISTPGKGSRSINSFKLQRFHRRRAWHHNWVGMPSHSRMPPACTCYPPSQCPRRTSLLKFPLLQKATCVSCGLKPRSSVRINQQRLVPNHIVRLNCPEARGVPSATKRSNTQTLGFK